jgi:hypothetical protein
MFCEMAARQWQPADITPVHRCSDWPEVVGLGPPETLPDSVQYHLNMIGKSAEIRRAFELSESRRGLVLKQAKFAGPGGSFGRGR